MRRKRTVVGAVVLALVAAGAVVSHAGMAGGPVVRTIAMADMQPWAIAMDAGTAHAFLVNRTTDPRGFGGGTGSVSVLDTATGAVLRTVSVGPDPRAVAVDPRTGRAFVANDDDATVSVLDTHSGGLLRALAVGPQPRAVALDPGTHRAFVVNTGDNTVSVVDTRRATVLRTIHIDTAAVVDSSRRPGSGVYGSPPGTYAPSLGPGAGFNGGYFQNGAVVDGRTNRVFVGGAGVVTVLDAGSGALLRTVTVGGDTSHMAVDAQSGQVYVTGDSGLVVLDGRTGVVRRTFAAGGPAGAVAVDPRRGRVFVAHTGAVNGSGTPAGPGTVSMLDARTGAILRTMSVGVAPVAVAVNDQNGQAVVVNAGGLVQAHTAWTWVPPSLQRLVPFAGQPSGTRTVPGSVSVLDASR